MAKPSNNQNDVARARIRAIIELRPEGKGRDQQKLQIANLVGYKGSERNKIRSVNRLITRKRDSKQARNLRSTKQTEAVNRSYNYYINKTGVIVLDRNKRLDIKNAVLPASTLANYIDNNESIFLQGLILPKAIFVNKRGLVAGRVGTSATGGADVTFRDIYSEVPKYGLGFANTFGFKDNKGNYLKNDLVSIFNKRVRILLSQEDGESKAMKIIFNESELPAEVRSRMLENKDRNLVLYARDAFPDNSKMETVVVN